MQKFLDLNKLKVELFSGWLLDLLKIIRYPQEKQNYHCNAVLK